MLTAVLSKAMPWWWGSSTGAAANLPLETAARYAVAAASAKVSIGGRFDFRCGGGSDGAGGACFDIALE